MSDDNLLRSGSGSLSEEMQQYLQVYIDESTEELEGLVEAILQLEDNPQHADALNKSFRMLHSLKGSSGMLGFEVAGNFAHELEDRFERYRSGKAVLDRETTTLILKCVDYFQGFLNRLRGKDLSEGDPSALLNQLRELEARAANTGSSSSVHVLKPSAGSKLPPVTMSGGLTILVKFREGLQLADLKARLIVSRLSSIGEIVACEPPIDDIHSFEELPLFSCLLVTTSPLADVRRIASVDGVESIEIVGGEEQAPLIRKEAELPPPAIIVAAEAPTANEPAPSAQPPAQGAVMPASPGDGVKAVTAGEPEPAETKGQANETVRVDISRLDRLMNLTGELVVANARFAQIAGEMSPLFRRNAVFKKSRDLSERLRERFELVRQSLPTEMRGRDEWIQCLQGLDEDLASLEQQSAVWEEGHRHFSDITEAVDQLTRVSKNLQHGVLNTRMVAVGPLFNRFKRVIRDLSVERGKQVQLVIQGEKTELDKRMIDALGDPLLHLVRNALDHGLESPAVRRAGGKPEVGTIVLEAAHRGNNVWISVRDDGGGISAQKIRERILSRGLATEAQISEMAESQVIDYIWHPGFSTAEAITEISGRGVGMDIVRNAITELNGTIDIRTVPGAGTTFTIRLPLTLAIIHSLLIRFRADCFSIPIDDVREIVSVPRDQIHAVHQHRTIDVRGVLIPLVGMGTIFDWPADACANTVPESSGSLSGLGDQRVVNVVILSSRGRTLGMCVDSLVGRSDLVVKSLSENYMAVRGLSGASILGDGAVCLMLDTAALVELAIERAQGLVKA
jgi:two-component system, chemotaxis family, sensor kinase CheA